MKAIFLLDKNSKLNNTLGGRDIRNLVGAILPDGEIKDRLMNKNKESHTQSFFIYPMSSTKSFEIVSYNNDIVALEEAIKHLVGQTITIKGNNIKIVKARIADFEYVLPKRDLVIYKTRTPIIVSSNNCEHKIVHNKQKNNQMGEWLKQKIEDLVKLQMKDYYNHDFEFDNLEIKLLEHNVRTFSPHKEKGDNVYFQGMYCTFISNYELPNFLGYQTGLGYGEIKKQNFGN